RGIILADTKFEFGLETGSDEPVLIDEIFTPDSSRFWPADEYEAGREQNSFDKQYVRNYLEELVAAGQWNKKYPGVVLPDEVITNTLSRYQEAYDRLTS
ncbi:MAG: phosphoribosylaminoimidazolesuccinocarboxamide synthase, partial [Gammaproteobacteria bacterium]|nr:phosphoribosylaminoimidazolesuccinocarboxamide synthase [Gammaproteobacteria bacterium]